MGVGNSNCGASERLDGGGRDGEAPAAAEPRREVAEAEAEGAGGQDGPADRQRERVHDVEVTLLMRHMFRP